MLRRLTSGLTAFFVFVVPSLAAAPPTSAPLATASIPAPDDTRLTVGIAALAAPQELEDAAIQLAHDLAAVPASVSSPGRSCPLSELRVSWERPEGYLHGSYIEPIGPRPGPDTTEVNGVVVCDRSLAGFMGFEAQLTGLTWRIHPVPVSEARPTGEPLEALPVPAAAPTGTLEEVETASLGRVDRYAEYEPQTTCDPTPKPGTQALGGLLLRSYPGTTGWGIARACDVGPVSEHKEGRAFDWGVAGQDRRLVEDALARLLATDEDGDPHALARRMGIMYIIWNDSIWSSYRADAGWRRYFGPDAHDDHVHISLSWEGATGLTSLWQSELRDGWLAEVPANGPIPPVRPPRAMALPATPEPSAAPTLAAPIGPSDTVPTEPPSAPPTEPAVEPSEPAPDPAPDPAGPVETAALLVRFGPGADEATTATVRDGIGAQLVRRLVSVPGLEHWTVPAAELDDVVARLRTDPAVRYAEADAPVAAVPMVEPAQPRAEPGDDQPADGAAAEEVAAESLPVVRVAVLGAGMDLGDATVSALLWTNGGEVPGDGVDDDGNGYVDDLYGWDFCADDAVAQAEGGATSLSTVVGTVADVLSAESLDPGSRRIELLPLRVVCADGTGRVTAVAAALDYAARIDAHLSLNGWRLADSGSSALADVLAVAARAGHLPVAPAGGPALPGAHFHRIVATVDPSD